MKLVEKKTGLEVFDGSNATFRGDRVVITEARLIGVTNPMGTIEVDWRGTRVRVLPSDLDLKWVEDDAPVEPEPQPDKSVVIELNNVLGWDLDPVMLDAAMKTVARHAYYASHIYIYPQERVPADAAPYKNPGSCHWIVRVISRGSKHTLTIGLIQRKPGDEVESHT